MESIVLLEILIIAVVLALAAVLIKTPKWIKVDYITLSRSTKVCLAIAFGFAPWIIAGGSWMMIGVINALVLYLIFERQNHFISIKFRS